MTKSYRYDFHDVSGLKLNIYSMHIYQVDISFKIEEIFKIQDFRMRPEISDAKEQKGLSGDIEKCISN